MLFPGGLYVFAAALRCTYCLNFGWAACAGRAMFCRGYVPRIASSLVHDDGLGCPACLPCFAGYLIHVQNLCCSSGSARDRPLLRSLRNRRRRPS